MATRREMFNAAADARYRRRKAEVWASLQPGEIIIADVSGSRLAVTVLEHLGPEIRVALEDGSESLVRRQAFHGIRAKEDI